MRDVIDAVLRWQERGERVAMATVVRTLGSSPRGLAAKMAVTDHGNIAGSVSGGCIEGAVYDACQHALKTGTAALLHFGVADEQAWEVGLACGGTIDVFVAPLPRIDAIQGTDSASIVVQRLVAQQPVAVATVLSGAATGQQLAVTADSTPHSDMPHSPLRDAILTHTVAMLADGVHGVYTVEGVDAFVEVYPPPPTIIMIGAVHISLELTTYAAQLGFRTVVVDARAAFATAERFGHADELVHAWPDEALAGRLHRNVAVVVLTHDPKLDDPALLVALPSDVRYVGALGSRKTHAERIERLRSAGLTAADVARVHAPIGLDIGGRTPAEIALSIMAQIVAVWNGKAE
jgi:xanthine dehydrogenase accessory factor